MWRRKLRPVTSWHAAACLKPSPTSASPSGCSPEVSDVFREYPPPSFLFLIPFLHMPIHPESRGAIPAQNRDEHIQTLYQWAKRLKMPMTRLVNALLAHALVRLEQGIENVSKPSAVSYSIKKHTKRRAQYGKPERTRGAA